MKTLQDMTKEELSKRLDSLRMDAAKVEDVRYPGMGAQRYITLFARDEGLTDEEVENGGHFRRGQDNILIHESRAAEMVKCRCPGYQLKREFQVPIDTPVDPETSDLVDDLELGTVRKLLMRPWRAAWFKWEGQRHLHQAPRHRFTASSTL